MHLFQKLRKSRCSLSISLCFPKLGCSLPPIPGVPPGVPLFFLVEIIDSSIKDYSIWQVLWDPIINRVTVCMYLHSTSSVQVNSIHCCSFTLKSSDHMVRISTVTLFFPGQPFSFYKREAASSNWFDLLCWHAVPYTSSLTIMSYVSMIMVVASVGF